MKLSKWAKKHGLTYKTAYRLFKSKKLPCRVEQLSTGTILVHEDQPELERTVIYGRVSSHDQKSDLERQMNRLRDFCSANGWPIYKDVSEIGSGLNGKRPGMIKILSDRTITRIVVEHKDRLARFGVEYIDASLSSVGRKIVVLNENESKDDLVQDFVDVVTSMCARIYGRRSSRNRAKKALEAAGENF